MITIQINQDDIKRPEVYEAMIHLVNQINGIQESPSASETKAQRSRRKHEQVGDPDIDAEVQQRYGAAISKAKSLYFLSIIKRNGTVDSLQIQSAMRQHYPQMTRKSIGGITGAVSRWFQKHNQRLPYDSTNDKTRNGIHIFTWLESQGLSDEERDELMSKMPNRYQAPFAKLLETGSIGKGELGNKFTAFSKAVNDLATNYFENEDNKIILRRS